MSGVSEIDVCPNCGNSAQVYMDWKPYSYYSYQCLHCGLVIYPKLEYMTLEELNKLREEYEWEPLTELPEQSMEL